MEDHPRIRLGLDVADLHKRNELAGQLKFAGLSLAADPEDADVVLGDGTQRHKFAAYISCGTVAGNDPLHVPEPVTLQALLGVLAQLQGQLQAEHQLVPAAMEYVGISPAAQRVREGVSRASSRDVTVLITGESGTGKDVVARALHAASGRAAGPYVPVNCGAIPQDLLESELFGHEKGAFTGAITQKTGRFEMAHGGTLFLDEIGDLPFAMQVKLLRAIENKSFERVGGMKSLVSDVRIIAATNQNLEDKILAGEFREDLYYRLNVFPIELAPLRDRLEDLQVLIDALLARIIDEQRVSIRFTQDALKVLAQYPWPGNVRELGNLLHRLAIQFPNGLIRSADLPQKYQSLLEQSSNRAASEAPGLVKLPVNGIDLKGYLTELEKSLIEQALQDTNAVVARAADRLHIRRTTLVEKMRKHGLNRTLDAVG